MMGQVFEEDFKTDFKNQFAALQTYLNRQNFLQAESPVQEKILSDLELSREEEVQSARQAFVEIKQQTIAYYLSTEEIAKNYLNYLPIPGEYKPCISVEEVNNTAWAI